MRRMWNLGLALVLLTGSGCFNKATTPSGSTCGASGSEVVVDSVAYCAYDKGIQVTGFNCPAAMPHKIDYMTMLVCSPSASVPEPTLQQIYTQAPKPDVVQPPSDTTSPPDLSPADVTATPDTVTSADAHTVDIASDTTTGCIEINVKPCIITKANGCCLSGPDSTVQPDCVNGQYVCPSGSVQNEEQCFSDAQCNDSGVMLMSPKTLKFFELPTGAIRMAVTGFDFTRSICAMMVFEFLQQPYCGEFTGSTGTGEFSPRVILKGGVNGPCSDSDFDFQTTTEVTAFKGCVDYKQFAQYNPKAMDLADFEVTVKDTLFNGKIVFNNRMVTEPKPVTFSLYVSNDVPESIYTQVSTAVANPTWVSVRKKGEQDYRQLFDECCACGAAQTLVKDITGGSSTGRISLTWDGVFRTPGSGLCNIHVPAEPGQYEARFCYGFVADLEGTAPNAFIKTPACFTVEFSYPTDKEVSYTLVGG